jgi:hypothetical protein
VESAKVQGRELAGRCVLEKLETGLLNVQAGLPKSYMQPGTKGDLRRI